MLAIVHKVTNRFDYFELNSSQKIYKNLSLEYNCSNRIQLRFVYTLKLNTHKKVIF